MSTEPYGLLPAVPVQKVVKAKWIFVKMVTVRVAKTLAPGEARTLDLRISLSVLTYKYDALTDCATGAYRKLRALLTLIQNDKEV